MFEVITIGGATRDIFFKYKDLRPKKEKGSLGGEILSIPYGSKLVTDDSEYCYGGGAVNCAVAFRRLGVKSAALCSMGKEGSGDLLLEFLRKENVSTSFIRRDPRLHTGLSIMIVGKDGEHTSFLDRGANDNLQIEKWGPLKKTKWLYISSLTGHAVNLLPEIFNFAERNGIKVAFNPGSKQLSDGYHYLKDYLGRVDILLLNLEEAMDLVYSKTKNKPASEVGILKELEKMGPKIAVVTEDGEGCHAIMAGKHFHQRAYSAKVVDTTGAGDSFGATFTFGIMNNFDISYSLKIAAINAASVVAEMGATKGLLNYNRIRSSKWL
jgi:sugar/nucleoside kinase (ribokinase family)